MSDLLIKGMEMPKKELILILFPDGKVATEEYEIGAKAKAVEVPAPHGRLIDADAVIDLVMQYCPDDDGMCSKAGADLRELLDEIENLPTVIPAEEGEA